MQGNYRHQPYLLSSSAAHKSSSPSAPNSLMSQSQSQSTSDNKPPRHLHSKQQHLGSDLNGLPSASSAANYSAFIKQQQHHHQQHHQDHSLRFNGGQYFTDHPHNQHQNHEQQAMRQVRASASSKCCMMAGDTPADLADQLSRQSLTHSGSSNNNNHRNSQLSAHGLSKQRNLLKQPRCQLGDPDDEAAQSYGHQNRDQYASQLRNSSQLQQYRLQSVSASFPSGGMASNHHQQQPASSGSASAKGAGSLQQQQQQRRPSASKEDRPLHVNFNRSNQAAGTDEEEGDSRKKKYLTAKYGQQQMNLIKKRLKIEMWLYERLQELAKDSVSKAELDEIDIDLDQLLDMDDDDTRRAWLKKTLQPFEDLASDGIEQFIGEVLEQSKLL